MLVHHRPAAGPDGTIWYDNGIRTHGSVSYHSIHESESHGCHRLFNLSAIQLASFLLQHRHHLARGVMPRPFVHEFTWRGMKLKLPIPHRGYAFELTPPVEAEVLPGTVRGRVHRVPQRMVALPRAKRPAAATATATTVAEATAAP
jgi:hypothetical protein